MGRDPRDLQKNEESAESRSENEKQVTQKSKAKRESEFGGCILKKER
jgi:hypothetical protein